MSKLNRQKRKEPLANPLGSALQLSSTMFNSQYKATKAVSVLVAKFEFEDRIHSGEVSAEEVRATLTNPSKFAAILLLAESAYRNKEEQKIQGRLSTLERQTHWLPTAGISFGAGMVTGLVCSFASPFITTWLQPTADQLFKREAATCQTTTSPKDAPINITNNFYSSSIPTAPERSNKSRTNTSKNRPRITCKNKTLDAYKASLLELLHQGDVVTLEMRGKKVSMCYRPNVDTTTQPKTLAR